MGCRGVSPSPTGIRKHLEYLETNMGWFRKIVVGSWLLLCLGSMVLTGCHTAEGAGEDIQSAGRSIERAAE